VTWCRCAGGSGDLTSQLVHQALAAVCPAVCPTGALENAMKDRGSLCIWSASLAVWSMSGVVYVRCVRASLAKCVVRP